MKTQRYTMTFYSEILDSEEMLAAMLAALDNFEGRAAVSEIQDVLYDGKPFDTPDSLEERVMALGKQTRPGRPITPVPKPQKRQKGKARR